MVVVEKEREGEESFSDEFYVIGGEDTDVALELSFPPSAVLLFGEDDDRANKKREITSMLRGIIVQNASPWPQIFRGSFDFGEGKSDTGTLDTARSDLEVAESGSSSGDTTTSRTSSSRDRGGRVLLVVAIRRCGRRRGCWGCCLWGQRGRYS